MSNDPNVELENFRRQWKEEVTARSTSSAPVHDNRSKTEAGPVKGITSTAKSTSARKPPQYSRSEDIKAAKDNFEAPGEVGTQEYHDFEDRDEVRKLGTEGEGIHPSTATAKKLSTALDHYEKAVEREEQGNLGDSVSLYRKAYKLDAGVDIIYPNKHFPPSSTKSKPTNPNPSNAPVTVPNPAHHSLDGPPASIPTISELIASFAGLAIPPIPPETDPSPHTPCPISTIPSELLIDILYRLAIADIASFARLSLVCKHLAHLVATEDRIWERICLGPEYGFAAMHYTWACSITGAALPTSLAEYPALSTLTLQLPPPPPPTPSTFPLTPTYPTHKAMFRSRPRLRFNGCYISTVNYIRPGSSTPSQVSWNTPVHIVTYYRYLRFFRDGTCASLLTTTEPIDVVHHLSKTNLAAKNGSSGAPSLLPPMSIMQHALRGRWKLSPPSSDPSTSTNSEEPEGSLTIETLGIDPEKYTYVLSLALKSAGRASGARSNKLAWRGFWSYNKLTDDWAEFGLRNDRAFFWSRVGSYGHGE
jgi:F-box protein 9